MENYVATGNSLIINIIRKRIGKLIDDINFKKECDIIPLTKEEFIKFSSTTNAKEFKLLSKEEILWLNDLKIIQVKKYKLKNTLFYDFELVNLLTNDVYKKLITDKILTLV